MSVNNKSNGVPAWVAKNFEQLNRITLSLEESHRENQRRIAQNDARIAQNDVRIGQNEKQITQTRAEAAEFKKITRIHSKAILKLLQK